ncbi:biotin--[acetyl-CoA-carboxylase] ligase [Taibaiella koreensis]|uniref:biotin--[acetyl-CoA-carboxylase] ligase n=1 Tax=Taibaiella koreensis TaxID=1268548 RepID=UPI000E59EDD2|nr:biotin--[acetyl-CoA-carboxylase] ligase [Taibaiella koreensis]
MAQNVENTFPKWLHYFDTIDSTNNYAMQRIDDGLAQQGEVIWAAHQLQGKGQRGKKWENDEGNVMMSLILKPVIPTERQFILSAAVALTIAKYLQTLSDRWQVAIKWPNDIYLNDKKACGILIENVFRGMHWAYSVAGIGLNVNQTAFPPELTRATSMAMVSGRQFDLTEIITDIRSGVLNLLQPLGPDRYPALLADYNKLLFRRDKETQFAEKATGRVFEAFVQEVNVEGQLVLLTHKGIEKYQFGALEWLLSPQ